MKIALDINHVYETKNQKFVVVEVYQQIRKERRSMVFFNISSNLNKYGAVEIGFMELYLTPL